MEYNIEDISYTEVTSVDQNDGHKFNEGMFKAVCRVPYSEFEFAPIYFRLKETIDYRIAPDPKEEHLKDIFKGIGRKLRSDLRSGEVPHAQDAQEGKIYIYSTNGIKEISEEKHGVTYIDYVDLDSDVEETTATGELHDKVELTDKELVSDDTISVRVPDDVPEDADTLAYMTSPDTNVPDVAKDVDVRMVAHMESMACETETQHPIDVNRSTFDFSFALQAHNETVNVTAENLFTDHFHLLVIPTQSLLNLEEEVQARVIPASAIKVNEELNAFTIENMKDLLAGDFTQEDEEIEYRIRLISSADLLEIEGDELTNTEWAKSSQGSDNIADIGFILTNAIEDIPFQIDSFAVTSEEPIELLKGIDCELHVKGRIENEDEEDFDLAVFLNDYLISAVFQAHALNDVDAEEDLIRNTEMTITDAIRVGNIVNFTLTATAPFNTAKVEEGTADERIVVNLGALGSYVHAEFKVASIPAPVIKSFEFVDGDAVLVAGHRKQIRFTLDREFLDDTDRKLFIEQHSWWVGKKEA